MQIIEAIRHSFSHVLAMAVLEFWPEAKLGIGPVIKNGFYYDFDLKHRLSPDDLPQIEKKMRELIKKDLKFIKREVSALEAKKIFGREPYKLELIKELAGNNAPITIYKSGDFTDLCAGPHIDSTKELNPEAFQLTKVAGAYWKGEEKKTQLQRIYGAGFETKKELETYLKMLGEAKKRDHRKLGEKLELFSFSDAAPGSVFWHPKGMIILNELEKFIRRLQKDRGYQETLTPILVKKALYEMSGHWQHYQENIFPLAIENEVYALKPMNCPGSALIYKSKTRSYRDLPLRFSEFGNLFRRERSGTLAGLFRVYGFIQDDAHIYCRPDQILKEIKGVLELLRTIHKTFGLKTSLALATKPDKAMGNPELWAKAEKALESALAQNRLKYELRPKDGAFYGPKIDVDVEDSLGRNWTVATIQLDFQIPEKLNLEYIDEKGEKQRPVIIHRSSIGSFERFIAILLEHYAGSLPLWLSPEQIWVLPIGAKHKKYAEEIGKTLENLGFRVQVKEENETVSKKIREGEMQKIPYLLIAGDKEIKARKVSVRERQKGDVGQMPLKKFLEKIK